MLGRTTVVAVTLASLVASGLVAAASSAAGPARPVVTAVHANSGSVSGLAHVIVEGRGFTRASVVRFGGVRSTLVRVASARELTAYAPPEHSGVVDVTVRTANGISATSGVSRYRYVHAQLPNPWVATKPPVPAGFSATLDQTISSVACPSTRCYYLAALVTSRDHSTPVIGTSDGTTISETVAPGPDGQPYASPNPRLGGLTCPSPTFCAAAGIDGPAGGRGSAVLLTLAGGKWTAIKAPLPPGTPSSVEEVVDSLSCGAPGACVAVGYLDEGNRPYPNVVLTLRDGTWTSAPAPAPISSGRQDGGAQVTCASASWCLIASARHLVVDRSGRYTTESFAFPPVAKGDYVGHAILGLACPAVSECTLLIESYSGRPMTYDFLTMREGKLAYHRIRAPADVDSAAGQLEANEYGFSCVDANTCLVNLVYPNAAVERQALVVRLHDDAVHVSAMPQFSANVRPPVFVSGVECSSAAACVAVGRQNARATYEVFADGVWTPQAISTAGLSDVRSTQAEQVSCSPSGRCLAIGVDVYNVTGHPPRRTSFVVMGSDR